MPTLEAAAARAERHWEDACARLEAERREPVSVERRVRVSASIAQVKIALDELDRAYRSWNAAA